MIQDKYWTAAGKVQVVEEVMQLGMSVSFVTVIMVFHIIIFLIEKYHDRRWKDCSSG
mgnify:FL=1